MAFVTESLQAFILARPPIVAFICSLIAITLTIFLVAFYIGDKDLVVDPHAQEDWNSLVKYLDSQKLCINFSNSFNSPRILKEINIDKTMPTISLDGMCFPVLINMSANHSQIFELANAARLEGLIYLQDWKRSCSNNHSQLEKNASVGLTLVIPAGLKYGKDVKAWVHLSGLPLPSMHNSSYCQAVNVSSQLIGELSSNDSPQLKFNTNINNSVCKADELVQLSYSSSPAPKVYLTVDDKVQIFLHLLQIGFVFLGVLFMLLVSGVIQGRTLVLTQRHTLLPTKEIS